MAETEITVDVSDGVELQGELFVPDSPRAAVVITHPHPLMGGDMYTPVPSALWSALPRLDAAGLRFNFRGVGRSTGTHDEGRAERLDVTAAIDRLAEEAPGVPIVMGGWSFGADVSLTITDDRVAGWFLAAPPLRVVEASAMAAATTAAPKLLAVPENDQFNPPANASESTDDWTNSEIRVIGGTDHFFGGGLAELTEAFADFVTALAPSA